MSTQSATQYLSSLLSHADVHINGTRAWDIQVHNEALYQRVVRHGSLGLGEAYMDGWWDAVQLDELFTRVLRAQLDKKIRLNMGVVVSAIAGRISNLQRTSRAFRIGEEHYDIGNDLYQAMLGKTLAYTCGYWKNAQTLDDAQEAKLDLVCRKLRLAPGQRILDIGCGWGSFLKYAAEHYGVSGVGITVSKEQATLAQERCKELPVEIRMQDYRSLGRNEQYDHVVSLGMFEHVGWKNYRTYMEVVRHCLKDDGLFLLHTIGGNRSVRHTDRWIAKYIFPNSMLPSIAQIGASIERLFVMEDWHNFSTYYNRTLLAWYQNVEAAWSVLEKKYDDRFHRMWKYYLLSCAGSFRSRNNQLWQIVLSKQGVPGGYESLR